MPEHHTETLIQDMKDESPDVRREAVASIKETSEISWKLLGAVIDRLFDEDGNTAWFAIRIVENFANHDAPMRALHRLAWIGADCSRIDASVAMAKRKPSWAVGPLLSVLISCEDWGLKRVAAEGLGDLGASASPAIPWLVEAFHGTDNADCMFGINQAIERLGGPNQYTRRGMPLFS